jgi:hypothetical protein
MSDSLTSNNLVDNSAERKAAEVLDHSAPQDEVETIIKAAFQELTDHINNSYRELREEIRSLYPDAFKECRGGYSKE